MIDGVLVKLTVKYILSTLITVDFDFVASESSEVTWSFIERKSAGSLPREASPLTISTACS
jgi:hypothetical protein